MVILISHIEIFVILVNGQMGWAVKCRLPTIPMGCIAAPGDSCNLFCCQINFSYMVLIYT